MNDFNFADITRTVVFFADSLFIGLKFAVPVLFIIHLLTRKSNHRDLQICIRSANQLLILGGLLFIFTIISNVLFAIISDNEAERDMMISFATGSHWYQFFFPIVNYALLPMVLWFKKLRKAPETAMLIISWWIASYFLTDYLSSINTSSHNFKNEIDFSDHFSKALVFLVVFSIFYGLGIWNENKRSANTK